MNDAPNFAPDDRDARRHSVALTVTVNSKTNFYVADAVNLSVGGIFVATPILHDIGTCFDVAIHLDDGDSAPLAGKGVVRWVRAADGSEPAGIGIQFDDLGSADKNRIRNFLRGSEPLSVGGSDRPPQLEATAKPPQILQGHHPPIGDDYATEGTIVGADPRHDTLPPPGGGLAASEPPPPSTPMDEPIEIIVEETHAFDIDF